MEHFFVVYDFSNDSRRSKFVKTLEKYGVRIQFSIFEFSLSKARKIEMLAKLKKLEYFTESKDEAVMIIPVSQDISKKIERYGNTIDVIGKSGIFSI
jgi:CRISPR-associated endonuclease Cas2